MLQPALQAYPLCAITKTAEVFSSHNRAGKWVDLDNHKRWMTRCLEAFGFLPWLFIFVWCIAFSDPGRVGLTKQRPLVREKESNPWKPPQNLPDYPRPILHVEICDVCKTHTIGSLAFLSSGSRSQAARPDRLTCTWHEARGALFATDTSYATE